MSEHHQADALPPSVFKAAWLIFKAMLPKTLSQQEAEAFAGLDACIAALASQPKPVALTWYEGPPPFPQDQEWFIAETTQGDPVVLRSLYEGGIKNGNFDFKTADGTYMKAALVKRWMQFPDCEYLPPAAVAAPTTGAQS